MKTLLLLPILIYVSISAFGCAGVSAIQDEQPPVGYKEARCITIQGQGRSGTFTQYIKGVANFFKLTLFGDFPEDTNIECGKDGLNIKINSLKKKDVETWRLMDDDVTVYEVIE